MRQIIEEINAKKVHSIYLLYGDESFFIDKVTDFIERNILTESEKAFNQSILYGKEITPQQIIDFCVQFPMMAERRVIIVKEAQQLKDISKLADYCSKPNPSTVLVLAYKSAKLDKRTSFWKALKKHAKIAEFKKMYDNQLPGHIQQLVESYNRKISAKSSALLAEYLGNDLAKIQNEITKLCLNVPEQTSISPQQIQDNVGISKDFNIFELQSAIGTRNAQKVFQICQYFYANPKSHPLVVSIGSIYRYFVKIWVTQQNQHLSDPELSKNLGLYNSYFLREYRAAAKMFTPLQLEHIFKLLKTYDLKSKGVDQRNATGQDLLTEMAAQILL